MARPKKPTALAKAEGNRSKRPIKEDVPIKGTLTKPKYLTPEGSLVWEELVRNVTAGVYQASDEFVIAAVAEEIAMWRLMVAATHAPGGLVSTGSTGQETISVYRKLQNETFNNVLKGAARLGLDPVSRPNLVLPPAAGNDDGVE